MLPITVRQNNGEVLVLSGLEPSEIDELREWFCYTKPIGPSVKIKAIPSSGQNGFSGAATGNELLPAEKPRDDS